MLLRAEDGVRGTLFDLDTNRVIQKPRWFDTETGKFSAWQVGADGKIVCNSRGEPLYYDGVGRLKFVPREDKPIAKPAECEPKPTIPIRPPSAKVIQKAKKLRAVLLGRRCSHYACDRVAEWAVSDEIEARPEVGILGGHKFAFERGRIIAQRWYCDFHYKPPRLLDDTGKEIKAVFEDAGGVRPQWHS